MTPRETAHKIVEAAIRELMAAKGGTVRGEITADTRLTDLPWNTRLQVVEEIERALDGRVSTRLGDAYQLRTVGEIVEAVERAMAARGCRCEEVNAASGACVYCDARAA
jgi:acyl carrier protein